MEDDKKNIFAVVVIARQIDGEYVFVRSEKAFSSAGKADKLMQKLKKEFIDSEGKPKPIKLTTAHGEAMCICEVGAFEMELE